MFTAPPAVCVGSGLLRLLLPLVGLIHPAQAASAWLSSSTALNAAGTSSTPAPQVAWLVRASPGTNGPAVRWSKSRTANAVSGVLLLIARAIISAAAPATKGAAKDVPLIRA